jgi:NADH-quinone oxidoreductase subunit N
MDHVGLLPAYLAAGTAVLALLADLVAPGRWRLPAVATALGAIGTAVAAVVVGSGDVRTSFCVAADGCSYRTDGFAALVAVIFAVLAVGTVALSTPALRAAAVPAGEYCFLLACSMTGGVMLGGARDLVFIIVAVEMVTIPLYVLVGLRRSARAVEASLIFFITSVVATSVALLGAGLLYAATGTVGINGIGAAMTRDGLPHAAAALIPVGIVLLLVGLAVKVAAVPVHGWAAPTYDGAPLPVAAFLSTASKFAGITALLVVVTALRTRLDVVGPVLATLAVATMTVGNLVALRQQRMVRLLAWSSIAQGGYLLAPLGALALAKADPKELLGATLAYTVFFVVLEFGVFGALIAVRGSSDGGRIAEYRGMAGTSWWATTALVLALTGLAGLPPGVAGLFAKVVVINALVGAGSTWLAVVVALNAVIGLAYYARVIAVLFARAEPEAQPASVPASVSVPEREPALVGAGVTSGGPTGSAALAAPVAAAAPVPTQVFAVPVAAAVIGVLTIVTVAGVAAGFAPQVVIDWAQHAIAALL